MGIETTFFDPAVGAGIGELIRDNTKVVYLEAPGSQTFEMQDVPAIAAAARARGAKVLIDNTWATPLFFKPFAHGVDVSIHAGRSEEHTSELQSLMRISYAVFCLKKKTQKQTDSSH